MELEEKMRIVQELVPGKQITLAHIIANPDKAFYAHIDYHDSGTLIMTGSVSEVQSALSAILEYCGGKSDFTVCDVTKT